MAIKSANFPANMVIAGYKPVEHDELKGSNDFATTSGDRVANNAQPKCKDLGVANDAMKKYGRNMARAMNQGG